MQRAEARRRRAENSSTTLKKSKWTVAIKSHLSKFNHIKLNIENTYIDDFIFSRNNYWRKKETKWEVRSLGAQVPGAPGVRHVWKYSRGSRPLLPRRKESARKKGMNFNFSVLFREGKVMFTLFVKTLSKINFLWFSVLFASIISSYIFWYNDTLPFYNATYLENTGIPQRYCGFNSRRLQ